MVGTAITGSDELVARARKGDREALARLLEREAPRIWRFGRRMCRQEEDASEIAQETMLLATRKLGQFRGDSSFSSWLFTIARSLCRRKRRKRSGEPETFDRIPLALLSGDASPEEDAIRKENVLAVETAIAELVPEHREAILLRDVEGLPIEEVARTLGLTLPAAKSRLHRARAALARKLAPREKPCEDISRLYSQYIEHDILPETCARMEAHVGSCPRCKSACEGLQQILTVCRSLPPEPVPARVADALRAALRESASQVLASHESNPRRKRVDRAKRTK